MPERLFFERTFAFFTSSGVVSSKRCDILGELLKMLRLRTVLFGVLALRWEDNLATRNAERNINMEAKGGGRL